MNDKKYALDSTAFYAGIPFQGEGRYYTTYQILDEVRHQRLVSQMIHSRVQVIEPSKESIRRTKTAAEKMGDARTLSEADVSIIAASLDLSSADNQSLVLVTDDFAVRNVAESLGVNLSESSIKGGEWRKITWVTYCKGCGKQYRDTKAKVCDVCGTKLSKKPGPS